MRPIEFDFYIIFFPSQKTLALLSTPSLPASGFWQGRVCWMDIRSSAFGIVVSGTPAPGINGVIAAVTIEVRNRGIEVIGFLDGFEHLCKGYKDRVMLVIVVIIHVIYIYMASVL